MGRLGAIFNQIINRLRGNRPSRPEDIPQKLDAKTLQHALDEARFLHSQEVDVKPLGRGEMPLPRRADKN